MCLSLPFSLFPCIPHSMQVGMCVPHGHRCAPTRAYPVTFQVPGASVQSCPPGGVRGGEGRFLHGFQAAPRFPPPGLSVLEEPSAEARCLQCPGLPAHLAHVWGVLMSCQYINTYGSKIYLKTECLTLPSSI